MDSAAVVLEAGEHDKLLESVDLSANEGTQHSMWDLYAKM